MKFGKRRQDAAAPDAPDAQVTVADSEEPQEPAVDSWTAPQAEQAGSAQQYAQTRVAHERPVAHEEPVAQTRVSHEQPAAHEEPVAYEEPAVEGEAIELPIEHVPAQAYAPPVPLTTEQRTVVSHEMPFPVAEEPVAVVTPDGEPPQISSLGDAGEAYASGHAAAPGPSWQEPVMALADERPELVVAAAFAGGLLAAMILRRLGN